MVRQRHRQPLSPGRDSLVAIVTVTWAQGLSPEEASLLTSCVCVYIMTGSRGVRNEGLLREPQQIGRNSLLVFY